MNLQLCIILFVVSLMILIPTTSSSSSVHYYNDNKYDYYTNFGHDISSIYSETSTNNARRILPARRNRRYVSYAALSRDSIPCNVRGASYYSNNCKPGKAINPYRRGCTQITRCARSNS
ncbi:hypothetical protein P3S67_016346 [Capsicum chacoense]